MAKQSFKEEVAGLHAWNRALAVIFALQGIVVLVIGTAKLFPVTVSFLARDPLQSQVAGHNVLVAASQHEFDLNLLYLLAAVFFIAAVIRLTMATLCRRRYEAELRRGINQFRWLEVALSGGLLMVVLALLVGVRDIITLLMLLSFVVVASLCALATEVYARAKPNHDQAAYWIALAAGAVALLATAWYLVADSLYGAAAVASTWMMFVTACIFFVAFFVNLFLVRHRLGRWSNYLYAERVYAGLSLVAISVLAWQAYAGNLH